MIIKKVEKEIDGLIGECLNDLELKEVLKIKTKRKFTIDVSSSDNEMDYDFFVKLIYDKEISFEMNYYEGQDKKMYIVGFDSFNIDKEV